MPCPPCLFCLRRIYSNSRAVTCDNCERWHHIRCGNTGISDADYDAAVSGGLDIQFVCQRCRHQQTDETGDVVMEEDDTVTQDTTTLTLPEDPSDRSGISTAASILEDEMDTSEPSVFDVTRPERSTVVEDLEASLADATVTDIPEATPVVFTIVESGSERGKPKLVSSDGYSYVFKRQLKSGAVDWRCSIRGKSNACQATVKQSGEEFRTSGSAHDHPAKPGLHIAVEVKKTVKAKAKTDIFETAHVLVSQVTEVYCIKTADEDFNLQMTVGFLQLLTRVRTFYEETMPSFALLAWEMGRGVPGSIANIMQEAIYLRVTDLTWQTVVVVAVCAVACISVCNRWKVARQEERQQVEISRARLDYLTNSWSVYDLAKTAYEPGHTEAVMYLVEKLQCDVNAAIPSNGLTLFLCACLSGRRDLVTFMLNRGANLRLTTKGGDTALYLATFGVLCSTKPDVTVLEQLVLAGCDVNTSNLSGYTPLHRAAAKGNKAVIKSLLKYGADPYLTSASGIYPMDCAVNAGHLEAAELLKLDIANPHVWDVVDPHTPTHIRLGLQSPQRKHLLESTRSRHINTLKSP